MPKQCVIESEPFVIENIIVIDDDEDEADWGGRPWVDGDMVGNLWVMAPMQIKGELNIIRLLKTIYEDQTEQGIKAKVLTETEYNSLDAYADDVRALVNSPEYPRISDFHNRRPFVEKFYNYQANIANFNESCPVEDEE